ncbi:hypothetical protein [Candidatus Williamhamiltonella defendens]
MASRHLVCSAMNALLEAAAHQTDNTLASTLFMHKKPYGENTGPEQEKRPGPLSSSACSSSGLLLLPRPTDGERIWIRKGKANGHQ